MNTTEYMELVRALAKNITPEYRSIILTRLTQINNQLLGLSQQSINENNHRRSQTYYNPLRDSSDYQSKDIMRPNTIAPKRKESVMMSHPATSHQDIPLPFDMPANTGLSREKYEDNYQRKMQNREYIDQGLELDDIIDDLVIKEDNKLDAKLRRLNELASKQISDNEPIYRKSNSDNDFDARLRRLTNLHSKIVSDNRARK